HRRAAGLDGGRPCEHGGVVGSTGKDDSARRARDARALGHLAGRHGAIPGNRSRRNRRRSACYLESAVLGYPAPTRSHHWQTPPEPVPLRPLLRIGALTLPSRLVCAPLAEVTHSAFRRLVAELGGCGLQFTEMLSGRALLYEDLRSSPYVKRRPVERAVFHQVMLRPGDPIERIVGRLSDIAPDGIDLNLACDAPAIRRLGAGSALFDDLPALAAVLNEVRRCWAGPLTVKIRLGHATPDCEAQLAERLRLIEDVGVDAITLHARFFEDKRKRPARHERLAWATTRTRLPIIGNGDIAGARTLHAHPAAFAA